MGNFFQFILNNPIIIILVLGGLFNVGVRAAQKAKEQRAKRAALAEIQRRKQEALRTGKPINEPVIVYDEPQKQQQSSALDERKARIEALRQQRMAQLRAMREKRSGVSTPPAAQVSQTPALKQRTVAPTPSTSSLKSTKKPRRQRTEPQLKSRRAQPPTTVQPPAARQREASQPQAQPKSRAIPQARPAPEAPAAPGSPIERGAISNAAGTSIRQLVRDPNLVRQAILAREILDTPIGLRDQGNMPGSLFD